MDPSVCRLHPGVAVTGFCPACLRDRLAGLQPPSSADLRRCKSFSYARSAVSQLEPQRRSCDLFRQEQPVIAVPEEEHQAVYYQKRMMEAEQPSSRKSSSSSFGGLLLGKKLQQWRRKKKEPPIIPEEMPGGRHRQHSFRDLQQQDPASWDAARSGLMFDHQLSPRAMLSVEEDCVPVVPRSDGQIPVEGDYYYYHYDDGHSNSNNAVPGGCAQTRDYYLDSSSSSRRRRSVDISGRNSLSDVNSESLLPSSWMTAATNANANARVSPAIAAADAHHQRVLVHHQFRSRDQLQPGSNYNYNPRDDFSGSFGSAFAPAANNKPNKKGIKGWRSIWGLLLQKKSSSSSRKPADAGHGSSGGGPAAGVGEGDHVVEEEYPWPELRARGYNGQMLRCSSSISARSSFSGGTAAMMVVGGSSARRSISGMEIMQQHDVHDAAGSAAAGRTRRDEALQLQLERNLSSRWSSYSRSSGRDHPMTMEAAGNYLQCSRANHNGVVIRSSKSNKPSSASLPRRMSTLYSADPIPRH